MKRTLIICRDLKNLSTIAPEPVTYYTVASDVVELHNIAKRYSWVNEVCWLEQKESFFNVAEDVKSIVDIINEWLHSLSTKNCIPAELLFWIKHAEGGMTTQRIQDALLLIRSYIHLIETTNPSSILITSTKGVEWENDILIKTANSMNIPVKVVGKRHRDVKSFLKLFIREPYYISKFLHSKLSMIRKSKNNDKEVVFQVCTSENKHLAHTIPLVKALHCKGYNPVVLCWGSPKCAIKIREMGLNSEYLEKYGSFSSIVNGDIKLVNTWRNAKKHKGALVDNPLLQYKNVPLGDIIWPSIQFFFSNSVAQRYRFLIAIKKYYTQHSPVAIRFWTMTMPEGTIALHNLPQSQTPIIFGNTGFHDLLDSPYLSKNEMLGLDLKLVTGERQKEKDEEYTLPKNKISVIGHVSWEHYNDLLLDKKESLKKLGVNHQYSKCILYDAGVFLRGFLSTQEQVETATVLLDFAEDNPEIALLIKPHPNHTSGTLDIIIKDYGLSNVYLIDKSKSIFDCINVADILITKWSTVGIESMYMKTPVVSVCLDKEHKFAIYGNAAHYIYEVEDLRILLNHEAFTSQWKEDLNCRAALFLSNNFYQPVHMTPSQIGADEIISSIQSRSIS